MSREKRKRNFVFCCLLDTNACTRLLAGSEAVRDMISTADTLYMSIFVLGELYAGFAGASKEQHTKEIGS